MSSSHEIAIDVKNISKSFKLAHEDNAFWGLHNVSFTLRKGEVMGIIGSNGSGKSTLLKILGGILKPTSGSANVYGSITSILNIGDNFHPDLSGRENVNIQLRIQRIPKSQWNELHQQIEAFSEIGHFYEQPVKTYSAGMFLRLAFAVAMQLASDILLLDEVLAVGDEGFQLKCREQLSQLAAMGKTILFVSHSRAEVLHLASRCLWLHQGVVRKIGAPTEILSEYFLMHKDKHEAQKMVQVSTLVKETTSGTSVDWLEEEAPGNDIMSIRHISITPHDGSESLYNTSPILFKFVIHKKKAGIHIGPFFFLEDTFYQPVLVSHFLNSSQGNKVVAETKDATGLIEITCLLPASFLMPGKYHVVLRFGMEENEWTPFSEEAFRFSDTLSFVLNPAPDFQDLVGNPTKGAVRPLFDWNVRIS